MQLEFKGPYQRDHTPPFKFNILILKTLIASVDQRVSLKAAGWRIPTRPRCFINICVSVKSWTCVTVYSEGIPCDAIRALHPHTDPHRPWNTIIPAWGRVASATVNSTVHSISKMTYMFIKSCPRRPSHLQCTQNPLLLGKPLMGRGGGGGGVVGHCIPTLV